MAASGTSHRVRVGQTEVDARSMYGALYWIAGSSQANCMRDADRISLACRTEAELPLPLKPECRRIRRHSWALWLPELAEEGCHSAGFDATIHDGHHLLLSLGWQSYVIPRSGASIPYLESAVNRI